MNYGIVSCFMADNTIFFCNIYLIHYWDSKKSSMDERR